MPTVIYFTHTGTRFEVQAPPGKNLMQAALDNNVPGILGDCGGACSCATCHAYVEAPWAARLPERSDTEVFMLEGVPDRRDNSRLCCQIRASEALDGITVHLPARQV